MNSPEPTVAPSVWDAPDFQGHQAVSFFRDRVTGIRGITAVHSFVNGRAAGGIRLRRYPNDDAALRDVLRLSSAMGRKAAVAGLDVGGAKTVILEGSATVSRLQMLKAVGRMVAAFNGAYYGAPDSGLTLTDLQIIKEDVPWILGSDQPAAPYTALGVLAAIKGALASSRGDASLSGVSVAVQGVGNVGVELVSLLVEAGAKVLITDQNAGKVATVAADLGVETFDADDFHSQQVDVLAPCALGGIFTSDSVDRIEAKVIAGAANNQLADDAIAQQFVDRGITYVPDYIANAGGLIAGVEEIGEFDHERAVAKIRAIEDTVREVLDEARNGGVTPLTIAERRAEHVWHQRQQ